ncbi:NapC/NirT family cytochrome c [Candidatus Latescibacterota bacterium]
MTQKRLPESVYNWTSVVGAILAVASLSIMVLLLLIDAMVQETTLYLGLLIFTVIPVFLIVGLILIAVGMLVERGRLSRGEDSHFGGEIHVDLRNPAHRNAAAIFVAGSTVLLIGTAIGSYNAYRQTESVEFCGTLCHAVMHPEYVAYQISAHARVPCAECHIGEGADWYVKSKLSGAYQVYATLVENYPKPIPTPVHNLRPARETCQHCHWPEQFFGGRQDVNYHFMGDEENTPYPITMMVNVGGGSEKLGGVEGIHWHVAESNRVEYVARDEERLEIARVRLTDGDGNTVEWNSADDPLSPEEMAASEARTMDCIDCHNRPSHNYRSPQRTVNQALASGWIDRALPYIKREAVTAMDRNYADTPAAMAGIDSHLRSFYEEEYPGIVVEQAAAIDTAVAVVQRQYRSSIFPEMKVSWRQYPDHIGHSEFIGCFRCHGSSLETADGEGISKDCSLCHTILSQGSGPGSELIAPSGLVFEHPEDIDGEELEVNCTECHEGGSEIY